mmetsp:Transcript_8534/g.18610  ORF Transcript_8534/g.18610 Transcript_8534/m.18610 type:complete len:690 (+) Transcript_8534:123-2192(+)
MVVSISTHGTAERDTSCISDIIAVVVPPCSSLRSPYFPSAGSTSHGAYRHRRGRGSIGAVAILAATAHLCLSSLNSSSGWWPQDTALIDAAVVRGGSVATTVAPAAALETPSSTPSFSSSSPFSSANWGSSVLPGHKAFVPSSSSKNGPVGIDFPPMAMSLSHPTGPFSSSPFPHFSATARATAKARTAAAAASASASASASLASASGWVVPSATMSFLPEQQKITSLDSSTAIPRMAEAPAPGGGRSGSVSSSSSSSSGGSLRSRASKNGAAAAVAAGTPIAFQDGSSLLQSTLNLLKNIIGSGMLSLPAGVAAFSNDPRAVVPASAATLLMAALSAYGFVLLGDVCSTTGEKTYQGAWSKAVSKSTSFIPAIACTSKAAIACVAFAMIMGDCLSMVLGCSRRTAIVGLASTVLFPLCRLKSLKPLSKFSAIGVASNFYVCFFILLRYLDGTYAVASPVQKLSSATLSGSVWGLAVNPGFITMASILSTSYLAHYNAPTFYDQLAADSNGSKDARFRLMSMVGFGLAGLAFCLLLCGGFWTFGEASSGLILNNYAPDDRLAILARLAMVVGMVTGYPLTFMGLRNQCVAMMGDAGKRLQEESSMALTAGLLTLLTAAAVSLKDLGKLVAIAGACFGSFLIYIAPALMVLGSKRKGLRPRGSVGGTVLQHLMVPLGLCLGISGVLQALR